MTIALSFKRRGRKAASVYEGRSGSSAEGEGDGHSPVKASRSVWGSIKRKPTTYPPYVKASERHLSLLPPLSPDLATFDLEDAPRAPRGEPEAAKATGFIRPKSRPSLTSRDSTTSIWSTSPLPPRSGTSMSQRKLSADLGWDVPCDFTDDFGTIRPSAGSSRCSAGSTPKQSPLYSLKSFSMTNLPSSLGKVNLSNFSPTSPRISNFTNHVNASMCDLLRFPAPPPRPASTIARSSGVSDFGAGGDIVPPRPARSAARIKSPQQWFARGPNKKNGLTMRHGNATTLSLVPVDPPQLDPIVFDLQPFLSTDRPASNRHSTVSAPGHISWRTDTFGVKRKTRLPSIPDVAVEGDSDDDMGSMGAEDAELGVSLKYALASIPASASTYSPPSPSPVRSRSPSPPSPLLPSRSSSLTPGPYGRTAWSRSSVAVSMASNFTRSSSSSGHSSIGDADSHSSASGTSSSSSSLWSDLGPLTPPAVTPTSQPFDDLTAERPLAPWMVLERRKGSLSFPSRANASCISLGRYP